MKKYFGIIFITCILAFSIIFIILPKENFSENENRILKSFPKISSTNILDGSFVKDLEGYIQDHFPFRNFFLSLKATAEISTLKKENNDVYLSKNDYLIKKPSNPDFKYYDKVIAIINKFEKTNEQNNINISLMLIPTSITLNEELLPKNVEYYSEPKIINYIYSKLGELNPKVNLLDVYSSLKQAKENGTNDLYFRLDHHWTTKGAYEAYKVYTKSMNIETIALDTFDKKIVTTNFNGTLYSKANIYFLPSDIIEAYSHKTNKFTVAYPSKKQTKNSLFDEGALLTKSKYGYFLAGDFDLVVVRNLSTTSKGNLLIIKDSYANSFVPFIANNFSETHLIDLRMFKSDTVSNYIRNNNITNVLLLFNTNTLPTYDILKLK